MSTEAEIASVIVMGSNGDGAKKAEMTNVGTGLSSDSSANTTSGSGENNVSFVNINYTIQPKPFLARFKEIPAKKILVNVR